MVKMPTEIRKRVLLGHPKTGCSLQCGQLGARRLDKPGLGRLGWSQRCFRNVAAPEKESFMHSI